MGCGRVTSGRHSTCCSMCGHVTAQQVQHGVHPHTTRCQKLQRRVRRLSQSQLPLHIDDRAEYCWTPGCSRASKAGYDACCSSCRLSLGACHSRRCRDNHGSAGSNPGPTTATTSADIEELDRQGLPCNRWIDRPLDSWYARAEENEDEHAQGSGLTQIEGAVSSHSRDLGGTSAGYAISSNVSSDGLLGTAMGDSRMLAQVDFAEMD